MIIIIPIHSIIIIIIHLAIIIIDNNVKRDQSHSYLSHSLIWIIQDWYYSIVMPIILIIYLSSLPNSKQKHK